MTALRVDKGGDKNPSPDGGSHKHTSPRIARQAMQDVPQESECSENLVVLNNLILFATVFLSDAESCGEGLDAGNEAEEGRADPGIDR